MALLFSLTSARARTLAVIAFAGGLSLSGGFRLAIAAPLPPTAPTNVVASIVEGKTIYEDTPTAALFDDAMYLLKHGRRFETCIEKLREAVRREPENAAFHRALACAYVNRAAVIADASVAASYKAGVRARYPAILAQWEKAQQDENAPLYGTPKPPPPPPVHRTMDDNKPFTLTPAEATSKATPLAEAAIKEFTLAVTLCKTPEERAETEYERGWGLFLLEQYTRRNLVLTLAKPPKHEEVIEAFIAATKNASDNPIYWQSLGESYTTFSWAEKAKKRPAEAVAAYERAVTLRRANPALWFRLYLLQEGDFPAKAETALRKAIDRDSGNAFLCYRLAEWLMRQPDTPPLGSPTSTNKKTDNGETQATKRQKNAEGIRFVQRGNASTRYNTIVERLAVPATLETTWNNSWGSGTGDAYMGEAELSLIIAIRTYVQELEKEGDAVHGAEAARALTQMGVKMFNIPEMAQLSPMEQWLYNNWASSAVETGYETAISLAKSTGNVSETNRLKAEFAQTEKEIAKRLETSRLLHDAAYGALQ